MKCSLRELFLLVALVAMGCGWWADRRYQEERHWQDMLDVVNQLRQHYESGKTNRPYNQGPLRLVSDKD